MATHTHSLSEQDKRDFCATMLQKYGLQLAIDNELLPVFFIAYNSALISEETGLKTKENLQRIITDFEKNTADKLSKLEIKQIQLSSPKVAFWFGFGKYGVLTVAISILLFAGWFLNRMEEKKEQDIAHISFLLDKSPVQEKKLNDSTIIQLITLFPANDLQNALAGKNYVYRKKCDCIEIPLYFQRTNQQK
jgi:hypothetical protein